MIFAGAEPNRTKILFVDFHQVLDRSASETTYETGKIPEANVRVVSNIVDFAADRGAKFFVFVLSYTQKSHTTLSGRFRIYAMHYSSTEWSDNYTFTDWLEWQKRSGL